MGKLGTEVQPDGLSVLTPARLHCFPCSATVSACPARAVLGKEYGIACGRRKVACPLNTLFWWGWLYVVSVFNFPYAGWLGFFLPENAILALFSGGVVSSLALLSGFCFCLPPEDGIIPKEGALLARFWGEQG